MSNKSLFKHLEDIKSKGRQIGGEHIIEGVKDGIFYTYTMLTSGAWKGGRVLYYEQTNTKEL